MGTREHSIATWCKRFQIDLWNLHEAPERGSPGLLIARQTWFGCMTGARQG